MWYDGLVFDHGLNELLQSCRKEVVLGLRLVMMGTGTFALPTFLGLYDTTHEVVGLFTQPDRTGRGHHRHRNLMKEAAIERGTPVFQPAKANTDGLDDLRSLNSDLLVVAAYGQILSAELLETPRLGAINLHASLLPKYRGAAPIQYAIRCGETETGVTIFKIEPRLDAGPILGVVKTPIGPKETSGELQERLAELSVPLAKDVIDQIANGTTNPIVQDVSQVTKAPRLKKEEGIVDWTMPADAIGWHVRGMQPWPKASSELHIPDYKPLRVILLDVETVDGIPDAKPGTARQTDGGELLVQAGDDNAIRIVRLQPENKKPMAVAEFLNGRMVPAGSRFGAGVI